MSAASLSASFIGRMEKWEKSIRALAQKHWSSTDGDSSGSSFGYPPDHDPDAERIIKHQIGGDTAIVETEIKKQSYPTFYEYRLKLVNGDWRIESNAMFFDREDEVLDEKKTRSLLEKTSFAPKLPPHDEGDEPNCEVLFEEGKVVKGTLMQKAEPIKVVKAGKLSLPSGMIIARDFGYAPDDAVPLSLRVKPGEYEVDACMLEGRVAAIRVVFGKSDKKPFHYRQAITVDNGSSVIGVDAGNVAICDALSFMQRSKRNHEREYQDWVKITTARTQSLPDITFLKLGASESNTAVVSGSGYGDGGYPSYWVFDADNELVAFIIDFQIAAEQLYRSVKVPWVSGCNGVIHQEDGLSVEVIRGSSIKVTGEQISEVRWLDSAGAVVFSGDQSSHSISSDNENTFGVDSTKLDGKASQMEILIYTGFRNNR